MPAEAAVSGSVIDISIVTLRQLNPSMAGVWLPSPRVNRRQAIRAPHTDFDIASLRWALLFEPLHVSPLLLSAPRTSLFSTFRICSGRPVGVPVLRTLPGTKCPSSAYY